MSENDTTDKGDTMSDLGLTLIDTRRAIPSSPAGDLGPNPELLVERLNAIGVQANANLLTSVLVLSPRHAWAEGTPGGYLNIIDGRWDVWGEVDRADWYSFAGSGGQVEIWFTGLPPGKLWLAVIEVSAYSGSTGGGPRQFRVGSSDTGPQFVDATFQQQYLGVLFEDRNAGGLSLIAITPVNLHAFAFYRATLVDVLG